MPSEALTYFAYSFRNCSIALWPRGVTVDTCRCQPDVQHILLHCQVYQVQRRILLSTFTNRGIRPTGTTLLGNDDCCIIDALFICLRDCDLINKL